MTENEYIKTLNINGREIKLGLDDCGQCYFIEWEENGKTKDVGLGTYNFHYMEEIYYMFDPIFKELAKKDLYGDEMTPEENKKWLEYKKIFNKEYELYE